MSDEIFEIGLISQSGECIVLLSRYLLKLEVGDRLLPKHEIARNYKIGIGTVQTAFRILETKNVVQINSRGHLGSFLVAKDNQLLWKYSMYHYVRGTMPLPYHDILMGFATGINNMFSHSSGPMLRMSYIRGSRIRIDNVLDGADDFTVCSLFAAKNIIKKRPEIRIFKEFSANTYMGKSVLLLRKGQEIKDGITVGIDTDSFDQEMLVREYFKDLQVNYEQVRYNNLFYMLNKGSIDASIWSAEDIKDFDGKTQNLPQRMTEIVEDVGKAVIIIKEKNYDKMKIVESLFDIPKIESVQKSIINHKGVPNY